MRILVLVLLLALPLSVLAAEEKITSTIVGDTNGVDMTQLEEIRRVQEQQLRMIMRMNRAEDLRNAEIQKRHEAFIKSIPELSPTAVASPAALPVATEAKPKKCGFWARLFGCADDTVTAKPAPQPGDSGTPELDDF